MSDIVAEIKELCRWFPIKEGIFDQMTGYGLQELLHTAGFTQFEMVHFTDSKNHEVYQCVKGLYSEQLLEMYDDEVLIDEMLMLEAERKSKSKIEVRALSAQGNHDDVSDAFVRAVWLCNKGTASKASNIATGAGGRLGGVGSRGIKVETRAGHMIKKRKMHGAHPRGLDNLGRRSRTRR
jgi:phage terminase large subunit-like protein